MLQMSRACAQEVRRTLRQRAVSVDLNPEIQESCIYDIAQFCSDKNHRGGELKCLQDNYDDLQYEDCREAVGELIEEEDKDAQMDRVLMKSCSNMIKKFCGVRA